MALAFVCVSVSYSHCLSTENSILVRAAHTSAQRNPFWKMLSIELMKAFQSNSTAQYSIYIYKSLTELKVNHLKNKNQILDVTVGFSGHTIACIRLLAHFWFGSKSKCRSIYNDNEFHLVWPTKLVCWCLLLLRMTKKRRGKFSVEINEPHLKQNNRKLTKNSFHINLASSILMKRSCSFL